MDHTIVHFEIPAEEPERAIAFYKELLGWNFQKWEGSPTPYWMVHTVPVDDQGKVARPGVNGGLMKRQHPQQPWANYVKVESVDDYAARAVTLGGQIALEKMAVPGMGWFVYLKDTEGNIFGLWQDDTSAGPA